MRRYPLNSRVVVRYGFEWYSGTVVGYDSRKRTAVKTDDPHVGYVVVDKNRIASLDSE